MSSPIGSLIVEAEKAAKKKANGHTAVAKGCTCEVTVVWISQSSNRVSISRCVEHVLERPVPAKAKGKRRGEVLV